MDLRERAKTLCEGIEGYMGRQVIQLQQLNARVDTSTATTAAAVNPMGDVQEQQWPPPPPLHLLQGGQQPQRPSLPQGPRPAAPSTQQISAIHRLAGPPLGAGAQMTGPTTLGAAPAATPRPTNPYLFTGPGYRYQQPQVPSQEQALFQQQPFQHQPGGIFMGQGYGSFQAQPDYGMGQYPTPYGGGTWQDGSGGYRQPVRFPATPHSGPALRGPGGLLLGVELLAGVAGQPSTRGILYLPAGGDSDHQIASRG
jgi:hypothetical protein